MDNEFTITLCVCPKCGTDRDRTTMNKFCPQCGTELIFNGLFIKVRDGEIKEAALTK